MTSVQVPTLKSLGVHEETIRRYDQRIPRYTSYPTAPFWTPDFGPAEWAKHLEQTSRERTTDLSLYVHIPFCGKRCLFCACNVIVTRKEGIAADYLEALEREVNLLARHYRGKSAVVQLHLGGGTPNFLTHAEMCSLVKLLADAFPFNPNAERSIEVDPRIADESDIEFLAAEAGFNRISFGVQDFHLETQHAIGREQTEECTFRNVRAARRSGFRSVNIDLIYGLPMQTEESWTSTLDSVIELRPDRIALYNFAFLPAKLAHQRLVDAHQMPSPELKLDMFMEAHNRLTKEGWEFIGMDHYALKEDSLTRAQRSGTLRRNFMGYTTLRGTDMIAFGTSAISDYQGAFAQNVKKLSHYRSMITEGILPIERGLALSEDDLLRRHVIEEIMCNGVLPFTGTKGEMIRALVATDRPQLEGLAADGLLTLSGAALKVTPKGRLFLRNIAVVFDSYIRNMTQAPLFSRAV